MIPYSKHSFSEKELDAVISQIQKGNIARGTIIDDFEQECSVYLDSHCVSCSSGSAALEVALRAAGVGPGDEVIVPNISWIATASSVNLVGAVPIFCDVMKGFPNIDIESVKRVISRRVKVVIPVHFGGVAVDLSELKEVCDAYGTLIIEDACHAMGGMYKDGTKIGSSNKSLAACFSFHPAKNITTGEGGLISTQSSNFLERVRVIRSGGVQRIGTSLTKKSFYDCTELGSNYHMTAISAAIGIVQLRKLNNFVEKRREIWSYYEQEISELEQFSLYQHPHYSGFNLCIASVNNHRNLLMELLIKDDIGVHFHYPLISELNIYNEKKVKSKVDSVLTNCYKYESNSLTLPLYPELSYKEVDYIVSRVKYHLGQFR